jgi:type IV secretory pathway VirB10-like protein
MGRSAGTPWPAPPPLQPPHRQRSRRWWVVMGIVVGLCAFAVVVWQVRRPDVTRPGDSTPAASPLPLPKPNQRVLPSVAEAPQPRMPAAEKPQASPDRAVTDVSPQPATINATVPAVKMPAPMAETAPVQPQTQPPRTAFPASDPMIAPAVDASRRPTVSAKANSPSKAAPQDAGKFFKSDPRIDLQALVWAPESAARFVVINNRLIKEGGSIDNIVVVRINPDDVLLAEGSDRWYEAFKIR